MRAEKTLQAMCLVNATSVGYWVLVVQTTGTHAKPDITGGLVTLEMESGSTTIVVEGI